LQEAQFLLVASRAILEKVRHFKDDIASLEHIFVIDDEGADSMADLERRGAVDPIPSLKPAPDDIAALIYTSGTTGDPKGVLLTHGNFVSNARGGGNLYSFLDESAVSLSILPWAHSYGQTAELYNWFQHGGSIGFMESVETLADDLQAVRPTFLIAVPRLFNRIYDGIVAKVGEKGGFAQKLFDVGVAAGAKKRELAARGRFSPVNELKLRAVDLVVFSQFRKRFGGRLKGSITASATMNLDISHFFWDIGIPVFDCYGLSETSPAITMNGPDAYRMGSVGRPIEHVEVRIDRTAVDDDAAERSDDGEIQVRGPNVMVGYHNKPNATREAFIEDGWFRTGDRGRVDEDGFLYITGRIKEQYKLQNGKYVFPASIEEDIRLLPYINNAMVVGEGRPYNVCLLVPELDILRKVAQQLQVRAGVERLIASPAVQEFISAEIRENLKGKYGGYEIPRKILIVDKDFTLENGMLTQTFKLKRRKVLERYGERLDALYEGD
jgi:long-chain acyl-CoA synthetase